VLESVYSTKFESIRVTRILYNVLLSGSVLLSRLRMRGVMQKEHVKRILVVELTKLGDLVSCLPLFSALSESFPRASIAVLVQPQHASLLSLVPEVGEVLASPASQHPASILQVVRKVRRENFDLVVSASPSVRHGILVLLSGAKYRFGYLEYTQAKVIHLQPHRVRALGFRLLNSAVQYPKNINERVNYLCSSLGLRVPGRTVVSKLFGDDSSTRPEVMDTIGIAEGVSCVMIHPFAGWEYRVWPTENVRELIHRILKTHTDCVLIVGADADRVRLEPLIAEFAGNPRVGFGIGLPLDGLARVIARSRLFIGGDSGPLHLATAVGTPNIGLFGPAPPELTGPLTLTNSYLYKKVECSPCDQEDCVRKWAPCITLISVDEVFDKVNDFLLAGDKPSSRPGAWLPNSLQDHRSPG